jgi:hypothetical protein
VSGAAPSGWQGPLRAAVAVFVVGFLVVWLVKPIGNPCPDLGRQPPGSSASSSPSLSPPGSRTCTYTAVGGVQAKVGHVPWLDWIILLLLAAVAGGAVRVASPGGRGARERAPARSPRPERQPRAKRAPRAQPAEPPPRPAPPPAGREPSRPTSSERDAADRERARRERAAHDRRR